MIILAVAVLHLGFAPVTAPASSPVAGAFAVLHTPHASIFHPEGQGQFASTTAAAFEFAYQSLGRDMGYPGGRIRIYIYHSAEEMVTGLMSVVGYDQQKAQLVAMIGASPSTAHTMHFHPKAKSWGPFFWHAVAHEYTHGLIEENYGAAVGSSARWLYEGLGEYEAHRALTVKFEDVEARWRRSRLKVVFKALVRGMLLPFEAITTEEQWYANILKSKETWNVQYAQAYVATMYLVESYGLAALKNVLEGIREGQSWQQAVEKTLGLSPSRFAMGLRVFILRKGLSEVYGGYAAGLLLAGGSIVTGTLLLVRKYKIGRRGR